MKNHLLTLNFKDYLLLQEDISKQILNKICLIEISNADLLISYYGSSTYYNVYQKIYDYISIKIQENPSFKLKIYNFTYKDFVIGANDCICDYKFESFIKEIITMIKKENFNLNKFDCEYKYALVFNGNDLLKRAKGAIYNNISNTQNYIIVKDDHTTIDSKITNEHVISDLMNYAINNDSVIPYYQGIYNNSLNRIDKYETLIRIKDHHKRVHKPSTFLDIAKKYNHYNKLSKIIISKVLEDFENKNIDISINLSLTDINDLKFKAWFLNKLDHYKNTNHLIIEFVDSQDYLLNENLKHFIYKLKTKGCKIAIDNFGIGLSSLKSIIALSPDIIKIDGSIIVNSLNNEEISGTLKLILAIASIINADIVAEHVENLNLQELVLQHKIKYSQGFYFSTPSELSKLNI